MFKTSVFGCHLLVGRQRHLVAKRRHFFPLKIALKRPIDPVFLLKVVMIKPHILDVLESNNQPTGSGSYPQYIRFFESKQTTMCKSEIKARPNCTMYHVVPCPVNPVYFNMGNTNCDVRNSGAP
uniref:Uncharacterized protein n=1 Tax=Strigamia maritima TaxID=126957 RepID=T1IT43_STRMM